jgi:hypothetical protein
MNSSKSTILGNTLIKTQMVFNIGLLWCVLWLSVACQPKINIAFDGYVEPYIGDTIPYSLASHEIISDKLLIFLPPSLDTVSFENTDLYKNIYKNGYDILCIYKAPAKGVMFYPRKNLDFKGQHVQFANNLIEHLKKSKKINPKANLSIMGMGMGSYMVPLISATHKADTSIFINGSPFSTFLTYERIANGDIPYTEGRASYLKEKFDLDSLSSFKIKVDAVKTDHPEMFTLGKYTNMFWLSYHANFFIEEYQSLTGKAVWVFFKDYPLNNISDLDYLKVLESTRKNASVDYLKLPGEGSFKGDDWEVMEETLIKYFPSN